MIAQKRTVRVILDIECYDDLDIEEQNWREILQLEGDEMFMLPLKIYKISSSVTLRELVSYSQ